MSSTGINVQMMNLLGSNQKLAAFYDFEFGSSSEFYSGVISGIRGDNLLYTGTINNQWPAYDTGKYTGIFINKVDSSEAGLDTKMRSVFSSVDFDLSESNLAVDTTDLDINNMSILIDFEFGGAVEDGVLFGSFIKEEETVNSVDYTGSYGFNVGFTSRGHLFLQNYSSNGDQIRVFNTELSKRNIIGVSSYRNKIVLSKLDYIEDEIDSISFNVESSYINNVDRFYFGGSERYYASTSAETTKTLVGNHINSISIFSGVISEGVLYSIGSGLVGEYSFTDAVEEERTRVTGYSESLVYKTGITGYEYIVTGTLNISTGREYISGVSLTTGTSSSKNEGEKYYKYYTLTDSINGSSTYYKEELGFLNSDNNYTYAPTGEDAYDTLGLQDASESIQDYIIDQYTGQDSITINLYGKNDLTGTLNEISGVVQTPLTETYTEITSQAVSGISMSASSEGLKKDYIYYLGERLS